MPAGKDEGTWGFNLQDATALANSIESREATYVEGRVRSGGGNAKWYLTPSGGIPARSGATLGSATCTLLNTKEGTRSVTSTMHTVYNNFSSAVAGSRDIQVDRIDGILQVRAEDCP